MTINAGQRVTADDLNELGPLDNIKPGDQSYTTTTLANDTDLVVQVAANMSYLVQIFLDYEGGTSGSADMKVGFSVPSGATFRYTNIGMNASAGVTGSFTGTESGTFTCQTSGAGQLRSMTVIGTLITGGTAGALQVKACQNTSNATPVIIHGQSSIWLQAGS